MCPASHGEFGIKAAFFPPIGTRRRLFPTLLTTPFSPLSPRGENICTRPLGPCPSSSGGSKKPAAFGAFFLRHTGGSQRTSVPRTLA